MNNAQRIAAENRQRQTSTAHLNRYAQAMRRVNDQCDWIEEHGGTLAGYVARYGSADDAVHYGDGGEAIYYADHDALVALKAAADALRPR